jgi:hypothetical protein
MEWQRLEQLRDLLQSEEEFGKIFSFFFDHLGGSENFIQAGTHAAPEFQAELLPILESILKRMVKQEVMIAQLLLTEVQTHRFYHGQCLSDAGFGCVLYFDDLKMGLVSLSPSVDSGMVHYARFTTLHVSRKHFVMPPRKRETSH